MFCNKKTHVYQFPWEPFWWNLWFWRGGWKNMLFIFESFWQLYYLIWSLKKSCVSMIDLFSSSTQGCQSNTTISKRSVVCFCLRNMPKTLSIFSLAREVPTLFLQTNQSTSLSPKSVAWAIQYIVFWLLLMGLVVYIYIYVYIHNMYSKQVNAGNIWSSWHTTRIWNLWKNIAFAEVGSGKQLRDIFGSQVVSSELCFVTLTKWRVFG